MAAPLAAGPTGPDLGWTAETWPRPSPRAAGPQVLADGLVGEVYFPDESVPSPWSIVLAVHDAPQPVAAVGLTAGSLGGAALSEEGFTVFRYLGSNPVTRAALGDFIADSERVGVATMAETGEEVIFVFPEASEATYIWIRFAGDTGTQRVELAEIALYTSEQLAQVRESRPLALRRLEPVDIEGLGDTNITGLPDLN